MVQPLTVRAILGFFLFASAAVVLGLSAFMQNNVSLHRLFPLSGSLPQSAPATYTHNLQSIEGERS